MAAPPLMHLRVKRKNETMFLLVEPSDSFGKLRAKVAEIAGQKTERVRLLRADKVRDRPRLFVSPQVTHTPHIAVVTPVGRRAGRSPLRRPRGPRPGRVALTSVRWLAPLARRPRRSRTSPS